MALVLEAPVKVSKATIRHILGKHLRRKWRSIKRIYLTKETAGARLAHSRYFRSREQELVEV